MCGMIARFALTAAGMLMLLFGVACQNYTKPDSIARHRQFAQGRDMPAPSNRIVYLGMLFAPLGGGLVGYAVGRGRKAGPV
jgi:hypothetical protein